MNLRRDVSFASLLLSLYVVGSCSLVFAPEDESTDSTGDPSLVETGGISIDDDDDETGGDGGTTDDGMTDGGTIMFTCPEGWEIGPEGHCYLGFSDSRVNWFDAESACNSFADDFTVGSVKSHLVSINSKTENDLVQRYRDDDAFIDIWIGLNKSETETVFTRFSNESAFLPQVFEAWDRTSTDTRKHEPNHPATEHCADFRNNGHWHDQGCGINPEINRHYVCEIEPISQ